MSVRRSLKGTVAAAVLSTVLSMCALPIHAQVTGQQAVWQLGPGSQYPLCQAGIAQALTSAGSYLSSHPADTLVLQIPAGTFALDDDGTAHGIFDVSNIHPQAGHLIIKGAGPQLTTLVFKGIVPDIYGANACQVSFVGMHFARQALTVSQGHVVSVTSQGNLVLDIDPGFPSPMEIYDSQSNQGRYLRRYTNTTQPLLITQNNNQVPWQSAQLISNNRWMIMVNHPGYFVNYAPGDLVGIKSKHAADAYFFSGGSGICFKDIEWTEESRGALRRMGGVSFIDCSIKRSPALGSIIPCLATPDGGPQFGNPGDPPTSSNLVQNCRFDATGDDAIAFFNDDGTSAVQNCTIEDSFARGILLYNSPNTDVSGNKVIRCPILYLQ